jgi:hypothetical protein
LPRRAFLRAGTGVLGGLTLANILREDARAASQRAPHSDKAMIVLWLWGGPSHLETFDLKPQAPSEYRGEFNPIPTNVPGIEITEHLPLLAARADQFALLRSLSHESPGHVNSTHTLVTGYPGELAEIPPYQPKHPNLWSVASKFLGERRTGLPVHVANRVRYDGAAYLGGGLEPFLVPGDPNSPKFQVPNLNINAVTRERFSNRMGLLSQFDHLRREIDASGLMSSMDNYDQQATTLLTGGAAARAFDLNQEDPRTRDRYGRHMVGQQCLLARRLVEAGVRLVTIDFPMVPGQKARSWDDHASVWNIFEEMKIRLPVLDQVVSALIDDLSARGLDREVLLLVMGEMSHTPRLSNYQGRPGRDHWGRAMSVFLAGGGLRMGQVVGSTNSKGEEPRTRPLAPNDFLATVYRTLGVPVEAQVGDYAGRPTPIVPHGQAIEELF